MAYAKCENCKKTFYTTNKDEKLCSNECRKAYNKRSQYGKYDKSSGRYFYTGLHHSVDYGTPERMIQG